MMRRRTRSTLPRPTTLFRSHTSELQSPQNLVCRLLLDWNSDVRSEEHTSELQSPQNLVCRLLLEKGREDRKSTRLNSSHLRISYAVFCLKKCSVHIASPLGSDIGLLATTLCDIRRAPGSRVRPCAPTPAPHLYSCARSILLFFLNDGRPPNLTPFPLPAPFRT